MDQKLIFPIFFLMLISLSVLISAKVDIDIQDIILVVEPEDGVISNKDHISVKATIGNLGDTDWTTPYYVKIYVNDKLHDSCSEECQPTEGIPVSEGLKAGQLEDFRWNDFATDREYLKLGENEIRFYLGFDNETEYAEKSITFDIVEGQLPEVDVEIIEAGVELKGSRITSIMATIKNKGPNIIEDDTIHIGVGIKSEDGTQDLGYYGGFIDFRKEILGEEDIRIMGVGDINYFIIDEKDRLKKINSRLSPGKYTFTFEIDDLNGLRNYEEINKDNSKLVHVVEIGDIEEEVVEPTEETGPIEIPEETREVVYFCSGCELENKCYTFGYRRDGKYCSDDKEEFIKEKEAGGICENNFECDSNVCVSGECVSGGLIDKILDWFKRIFGSE